MYTNHSCTNTHYVDISNISAGGTVFYIIVNSSGYRSRSRYETIYNNTVLNMSFYLPPIELPPGEGEPGENYTRMYRLRVINDISQPIPNATAIIKKLISTTGEYEILSTIITNGYGECDLWLIPSTHYKVFLSKDGYQDTIAEWTPDPVFYGANYPFIVQMYANPVIPQPPILGDITFTATLSADDTTIWANYSDISGFTNYTVLTISIFNYSTLSWDIIGTFTNTSQNWVKTITGVNRSNDYYFNLTIYHDFLSTFHIQRVIEAEIDQMINDTTFEDRFSWIGVIPFGAYNFFSWLFFIAICYYADSRDAGKIIMVFGVICLFLGIYLGLNSPLTVAGGVLGGGIAVIFIILGLLMEWNTSKKRA